jgi:23S rRNA pseudouridine2605 synthase
LNRFLARHSGISRRQADQRILEGRVRVNGQQVLHPGLLVDEANDSVTLDGQMITIEPGYLYVLLHKPAGYLVTAADPQGRPTVYELIREVPRRVFPVGRLDRDTEGVLLLTDDGDLAHRLMHPRHEVIKGYRADVKGSVRAADVVRLTKGLTLEDGLSRARSARLESAASSHSVIYLELITGKKRQVKRMCAAIGHPVVKLQRVSFGGLTAGDLAVGRWRYLTPEEIARLSGIAHQRR